jgi:archaellum component FlaC
MSNWEALQIKIPGQDLMEDVRSSLEALVTFMEIIKALLETISLFLIDFGNPIRAIVQSLLTLIQELFNSLKQTGLFALFDVPNPTQDPNFDRFKGGYQAFVERFKASLFDSKDPFRPQPAAGQTLSGFVIIVADAETVFGLLRLIKILLRFFGKEISSAKYAAPANVRIFPAGSKPGATGGTNFDPILQVASVFGATLKGFAIEWSLATNQYPPDPGFNDLLASVSSELIPQNWLIEKTSNSGGPITLTLNAETNFEDKRGKAIKRTIPVRDENGDYFRVFEKYIVIDPTTSTSTFLLGQLGRFRYLDSLVNKDTTYYYRIRAFSGPLVVTVNNTIDFPAPEQKADTGEYIQRWPSSDPNNPVIMGRPSGIVTCRIPNIPADFDVITALENTFKMAFALGFHNPLDPTATFDANGRPTGSTSATKVGQGSLMNLGGALSDIIPTAISSVQKNPVTEEYPDVVQNYLSVKFQSSRLAQVVSASLLENSAMLNPLRDLYQGAIPLPIPSVGNFKGSNSTIEKMVTAFNNIPDDFPSADHPEVYLTSNSAFKDVNTRLNLLQAVTLIKSFTLGGTPPDWTSVSLLRDIIPWSGQFIYDLLNRIDALLDAFKSAIEEIKAFIDTVVRKIDILERFIKYLIEILNYLDSFSAGFYFLSVPSTAGGIPGWISAIDNAGGTKPPSGPGGYSAGVSLAYAGTNIDSFVTAFNLIF